MKNYPAFEKLAHEIQHGLQGFVVTKIKSESTKVNLLVIFCRSGSSTCNGAAWEVFLELVYL